MEVSVGVDAAEGEVGGGVELVSPEAGGGEGFFFEVFAEGGEEAGVEDEDAGGAPSEAGDGAALVFGGVVSGDDGTSTEDVLFGAELDVVEGVGG